MARTRVHLAPGKNKGRKKEARKATGKPRDLTKKVSGVAPISAAVAAQYSDTTAPHRPKRNPARSGSVKTKRNPTRGMSSPARTVKPAAKRAAKATPGAGGRGPASGAPGKAMREKALREKQKQRFRKSLRDRAANRG